MLLQLGFGVGLRPVHYPDFQSQKTPPIDWLEIISENFMGIGGQARKHLATIRSNFPIATHGVGLGIAGSDPLDMRYLRLLKEHITWLEPILVTDHLCWTSWRGRHSYDLLPFPMHEESLKHICSRLHAVQELLGRRMLIENPSTYIDFKGSAIAEPEFLNEMCARTGCGILLDLNNCIVNSKNLGWDPQLYIKSLNPQYVGQFHLAGHSVSPEICIDTHDQPVPDEVWQLYRSAAQLFPQVPTLLEWDDHIPELSLLGDELARARAESRTAMSGEPEESRPAGMVYEISARAPEHSLAQQQEALFEVLTGKSSGAEFSQSLKNTLGRQKAGLRAYSNNFYLRYLETMKDSFPTLYGIIEDEAMAEVVAQFIQHIPGEHFSVNFAGEKLATFIAEFELAIDFGVPQAMIAELAAFDWVRLELFLLPDDPCPHLDFGQLAAWNDEQWTAARFALRDEYRLLDLRWNILGVAEALEAKRAPAPPELARAPLLVYRTEAGLSTESCAPDLATLLGFRSLSFTLEDLVNANKLADGCSEEAAAEAAVNALVLAAQKQLLRLADDQKSWLVAGQ